MTERFKKYHTIILNRYCLDIDSNKSYKTMDNGENLNTGYFMTLRKYLFFSGDDIAVMIF